MTEIILITEDTLSCGSSRNFFPNFFLIILYYYTSTCFSCISGAEMHAVMCSGDIRTGVGDLRLHFVVLLRNLLWGI